MGDDWSDRGGRLLLYDAKVQEEERRLVKSLNEAVKKGDRLQSDNASDGLAK